MGFFSYVCVCVWRGTEKEGEWDRGGREGGREEWMNEWEYFFILLKSLRVIGIYPLFSPGLSQSSEQESWVSIPLVTSDVLLQPFPV